MRTFFVFFSPTSPKDVVVICMYFPPYFPLFVNLVIFPHLHSIIQVEFLIKLLFQFALL